MAIYLHGEQVTNVFRLAGNNENSASFALGWALDQSECFLKLVMQAAFGEDIDVNDVVVMLQKRGDDYGYTDIELLSGQLHAILEAKLSWNLPGVAQLNRYRTRLVDGGAKRQLFVSISAANQEHARRLLPPTLDGVGLRHLSWGDLQRLARRAEKSVCSFQEKLWLRQLAQHLQEFVSMERISSNMVYMVVLRNEAMVAGKKHTWVDVVEKDQCYFHPVGNGSNR